MHVLISGQSMQISDGWSHKSVGGRRVQCRVASRKDENVAENCVKEALGENVTHYY